MSEGDLKASCRAIMGMEHLMIHEAVGCGINRVHKSTMQLASFYFHMLEYGLFQMSVRNQYLAL